MADDEHLPAPVQVGLRLIRLNQQMRELIRDYRRARDVMDAKKRDARKAEARAFLTATGPMDLRKWQARLDSADAVFEWDAAVTIVEALDKEIYALGREIGSTQSVGATSREELRTLGADT